MSRHHAEQREARRQEAAAHVTAMAPEEHLRRAADVYATPTAECYRTGQLLQVLVELGFAIAKTTWSRP